MDLVYESLYFFVVLFYKVTRYDEPRCISAHGSTGGVFGFTCKNKDCGFSPKTIVNSNSKSFSLLIDGRKLIYIVQVFLNLIELEKQLNLFIFILRIKINNYPIFNWCVWGA